MKGDFSRDSFDSGKGYGRVLQQQGRLTQFRLPPGVYHHYAPLAVLAGDGQVIDCRRVFRRLATPVSRCG